jgi:hypothetical protein
MQTDYSGVGGEVATVHYPSQLFRVGRSNRRSRWVALGCMTMAAVVLNAMERAQPTHPWPTLQAPSPAWVLG